MNTMPQTSRTDERGFVLVLVLVTLLLLTVLGIWASRSAQMELRTAANERKHQATFYQADAGTHLAERLIYHNRVCASLSLDNSNNCYFGKGGQNHERLPTKETLKFNDYCFTTNSDLIVENLEDKDIKEVSDDNYTIRYKPNPAPDEAHTNIKLYQLKTSAPEGTDLEFTRVDSVRMRTQYIIQSQHVVPKQLGDEDGYETESKVGILWQVSGVDSNTRQEDCAYYY